MAAVYDSLEARDKAMERAKNETFTFKGVKVDIIIEAFGAAVAEDGPYCWFINIAMVEIDLGLVLNVEAFARVHPALKGMQFEIRPMLQRGAPNGTVVIGN